MTLELILRAIPNFRKIHQDMLAKAAPGTGMWLLKSERFSLWLEPNGDLKILWGSGIPGAGKTIIAALVIDMLEAMARVSGAKTSNAPEMTVRSVLEVFVKQMVERHPDALPIVRKSQLLGLLQHLTDYVATIFVLDALDEAPTEIQVDLSQEPRLAKLQDASLPRDLSAQKLERNTYLRGLLAQADTSLREEIISTIKRRSGGMFLHASLQLDALCHCLSIHDVQETIEQFPSEIEDAYGQTWRRILNQHQRHVSLAKSVMLWVVNAARSMSIEELRRAVATRPDNHKFEPARMVPEATLLGLCHGLVVLEEESRLVRLVHYTARKPVEALLLEFFPHPHRLFTAVCITHLTDCGFQNTTIDSEERLKQALDDDPLLAYSHDAWACHAQLSLDDKILVTQLTTFLEDCQAFPALIYHRFDRVTALHLVAFYKLPFSFAGSLDDLNLNLRTEVGGYTPMGLACLRGHQTGVQALLSLPGSVNTVDRAGYSPLMYAAFKGYDGIVRLLLACPDIQVNLVNLSGASALLHAAFNGDHTTFELLLARPEIQHLRLPPAEAMTGLSNSSLIDLRLTPTLPIPMAQQLFYWRHSLGMSKLSSFSSPPPASIQINATGMATQRSRWQRNMDMKRLSVRSSRFLELISQ
ncbi:hypothetical protein BKA70DRAFT_1332666 [Coprinopsis sp. MPI-PUGE-AT-0042]|nr:hypothetical protein BKA70DRAFT_1332666 [Coprinopsis sp. MPI-PUGE-AT-0042]